MMTPARCIFYILSAGLLLLSGCARPVAPEGGEKDTRPPQLDTAHSAPNRVTRFEKKPLEFHFDEWLVLKDPSQQVLISPPLAKNPEITLRGKKVTVAFDKKEELRPNTTYTINFGEAITDFTEGNALKNFTYVFSTGAFIDSLALAGALTDAFTEKPIDNIGIALYESDADSTPLKERPYYYAKTDKTGAFSFQNLKSGAFRVLAFDDQNQNKRWDGETEKIAFADTLLNLRAGNTPALALRLFNQKPAHRLASKETSTYGVVKLAYAAGGDTASWRPALALPGMQFLEERANDTLYIWYDRPDSTAAWQVIAGRDTVRIKGFSRPAFASGNGLRLAGAPAPAKESGARDKKKKDFTPKPNPASISKSIVQHPAKKATIEFNQPVVSTDTARWILSYDSNRVQVRQFSVAPDSASKRKLVLNLPWMPQQRYQLLLLPGAATGFFGQPNRDTIQLEYAVMDDRTFASVALVCKGLKPATPYVVELLAGDKVEARRTLRPDSPSAKLKFEKLQAGAYSVRVTEDVNASGRWDTGDYWNHKQPERVYNKTLDALRPNWETEAEIDLTPATADPKEKKFKSKPDAKEDHRH